MRLIHYLPIPFAMIGMFLLVGYGISLLLKVDSKRRGVFINTMGFSNTVIVGFVIAAVLFGEEALPIAMSYLCSKYYYVLDNRGLAFKTGRGRKRLLNICGWIEKDILTSASGFFSGAVFIFLNIKIPEWIFSPLQQIGKTTTPLAMIMTGSVLKHLKPGEIRLSKDILVLLLNRFLIAPFILLIIYIILPLDKMSKQVYLVMTVMPAMTQLGIVARESKADYEFAPILIVLTTVISMALMPVYSAVIAWFFV